MGCICRTWRARRENDPTRGGPHDDPADMSDNPTIPAMPQSLWAATAAEPAFEPPSLEGEARADVVVIGGGFTGVSTALHLAERGISVVLLEAAEIGWGASGRNGGQVIPGLKSDPDEIEAALGPDRGARL